MTTISLLGDFDDQLLTHRELAAAVGLFPDHVSASWVATDSPDSHRQVSATDALWVIPGTPYKNDSLVYECIRQAREQEKPFLGTCGGFQYAMVEYARNVLGINDASHAEVSPHSSRQVISQLSCSLVGEEREVSTVPGSLLRQVYGPEPFMGFHFCNFGLSEQYEKLLSDGGLKFSANAADAGIEAAELTSHPFYVATLFQPQVGSLAGKPLNPLIGEFIRAVSTS